MPMRTGTPLPELNGATEWVNGEVTRESLLGSPTLIHFWAKSCHVCHDNMPTVEQWRENYADKGLKVVAIHMPREEADTDVEAVKADAVELGIQESIWPSTTTMPLGSDLRTSSGPPILSSTAKATCVVVRQAMPD